MALSGDLFAWDGDVLGVRAALLLLRERVPVLVATETVGLASGDGRVLATDVVAPFDLPRFDNAAVDGYSLRFEDLPASPGAPRRVTGRVAAGERPAAVGAGAASRIFTGAALPPGHDTVAMQEDCSVDADGRLLLPPGLSRGANRRRAGEDVCRGDVALPAGRRLSPSDLALAAALGHATLPVRRPPRVALFSTGRELVGPGEPAGEAQLFDANRPMLTALFRRFGCAVADGGILPDRPEVIRARLADAAGEHDLVVTSGGVSAGEEDHVRAAVAALGSVATWRVAVKPGRPVALGTVCDAAFLGLPGNPVSAFVTAVTLGRALVAALAGERYEEPVPVPVMAGFTLTRRPGLREYVRVRLATVAGAAVAERVVPHGTGNLTSLTRADGFAILGEDVTAVVPGETVPFVPFAVYL